jgi:hypothetical protein
MPRPPSPGVAFLKDPDVRRWYDACASRSQATADVRMRDLGSYCLRVGTTPKALITASMLAGRQKKLHDQILDYIKAETARGMTGPTIANRVDALKSWLDHNGIQLAHRVRIAGQDDAPTLRDERTPTQDELHSILLAASLQSRVGLVLMAHSGLRPEVLGSYRGNDGGACAMGVGREPHVTPGRRPESRSGTREPSPARTSTNDPKFANASAPHFRPLSSRRNGLRLPLPV